MEDQKRKLDEAQARGQISVDDPALLRGKRRRIDNHSKDLQHRANGSERGRGRGRGKGRIRGTDGGWSGRGRGRGGSTVPIRGDTRSPMTGAAHSTPKSPPATAARDTDASSDSDSDAPPEVISSRPPPDVIGHGVSLSKEIPDSALEIKIPVRNKTEEPDIPVVAHTSDDSAKLVNKPRPAQPKKAPYNRFASRPTLLRNVSRLDIAPARPLIIFNCSFFFLKYG